MTVQELIAGGDGGVAGRDPEPEGAGFGAAADALGALGALGGIATCLATMLRFCGGLFAGAVDALGAGAGVGAGLGAGLGVGLGAGVSGFNWCAGALGGRQGAHDCSLASDCFLASSALCLAICAIPCE